MNSFANEKLKIPAFNFLLDAVLLSAIKIVESSGSALGIDGSNCETIVWMKLALNPYN